MSAVELQSQISELQLAFAEQAQKSELAQAEQAQKLAEQAQKLAEQAQKLAEQDQKLAELDQKSELAHAELAEQKEKLDEVLKLNAQSRVRDARSRIGELLILSFFLQCLSTLLNFPMSHVCCSFFVV